ncbi:MAG: hydroxymethylbilane synthase [Acidobacteria bacterium]|nr:hydroxymethylbilane synthase [Acidobacteriota bacterium]
MPRLRIGSRGSQLALWQANHIGARLRAQGHEVDITTIKTTGDRIQDVPLAHVGTKGMFTKEIEEALAAGYVDLAVHSLKDLPTTLPAGFALAAITQRDDPRDVFISSRFSAPGDLPEGATVGTSSLRRQAQLRALRPDLQVIPLRGNIDTRMRKMREQLDAIVLSAAGLQRLQLSAPHLYYFSIDEMCPAAGQGTLAIEVREGDVSTSNAVAMLDHARTRIAITAERAALERLGGGCQVPIGIHAAFASPAGEDLLLNAIVASPDGSELLRHAEIGCEPVPLGYAAAEALIAAGADRILGAVYGADAAIPQQP